VEALSNDLLLASGESEDDVAVESRLGRANGPSQPALSYARDVGRFSLG
jgi:hypothetical protein